MRGARARRSSASPATTGAFARWEAFDARVGAVAARLFPTFTEPLRSRADLRALAGDDATWADLVEQPLGRALRAPFPDDLVRGVVLTDGLIGTFAAADDPSLAQNRCFLYHVVGNGTGDWDVPVGGMGAVTDALAAAARAAGATLRDRRRGHGRAQRRPRGRGRARRRRGRRRPRRPVRRGARRAAPPAGRGGRGAAGPEPEGCQLKLNLLVRRLPRLRDPDVDPREAFAGTFHVHESASELDAAHAAARAGRLPDPVPCELYCHSLADPSILGPSCAPRAPRP